MERQEYISELLRVFTACLPERFTAARFFDLFPDPLQIIQILGPTGRYRLFGGCGLPLAWGAREISFDKLCSLKIDWWYGKLRKMGAIKEEHHRNALPLAIQAQYPWAWNRGWIEADEWWREKTPGTRDALVSAVELSLKFLPQLRRTLAATTLRLEIMRDKIPKEFLVAFIRTLPKQLEQRRIDLAGLYVEFFSDVNLLRLIPAEYGWGILQVAFNMVSAQETPSRGVRVPDKEDIEITLEIDGQEHEETELTEADLELIR